MNEQYFGSNLVEVLQQRAMHQGDRIAFTFLAGCERELGSVTFRELDSRAQLLAAHLQHHAKRGERALLVYPSGLDYVVAFFGCLYAEIIPVPVYPPRGNSNLGRLLAIGDDCQATLLLCNQDFRPHLQTEKLPRNRQSQFHLIQTDILASTNGHSTGIWQKPEISSDAVAFLQYTSGSTASPKGVVVSHGNLMHNLKAMAERFGLTERSQYVSWLPIYHDMGLIGVILSVPYVGSRCFLISPSDFIRYPARLLDVFSRYRATCGVAPNFAYDLMVRKASAEQLEKLDLSNLSLAVTGAEPIRAETVRRFVETFETCGLANNATRPAYGLAEATLLVAAANNGVAPAIKAFDANSLAQDLIVEVPETWKNSRLLVSCGPGLSDQQIAIVNPDTLMECPSGQVGEIWVKGPSVAQGYWNKPDATKAAFQAYIAGSGSGPFLRTGDLGFLHEGELYVTGRHKDLIIVNGRNHYPQDIEFTVEQSHPALRPGCGAAFSVTGEENERVVVAYEIDRSQVRGPNLDEIAGCVRRAVAEEHELEIDTVTFLKPATIPKTSSGKIQRGLCRTMFLSGKLETFPESRVAAPAASPFRNLAPTPAVNREPMQFSLFYFSSNEAEFKRHKYRLLLEGARFADEHDFAAVWVPERHFHAFGGLYPNPSVLASALAVETKRVRIRAGSVVLPLHNPIRVAEEWSVVDNLSDGRVDLAFARGWNPNDFVLAPSNYAESLKVLYKSMEVVQKLWRGGSIPVPNGKGEEVPVKIYPLPCQPELNLWLTCSGGEDRFIEAGAAGVNILTALLFQSVDELARKLASYRQARVQAGLDPAKGHVTLMMHTFVGVDQEEVKEKVRGPFIEYLKTSVDLWQNGSHDLKTLTEDQRHEVLNLAFERYYQTSGLFGTPETCLETIERLRQVGVDEIACLIDFGIETEDTLKGLHALHWLQEKARASAKACAPHIAIAAAAGTGNGFHTGTSSRKIESSVPAALQNQPEPAIGPQREFLPGDRELVHQVRQNIVAVIASVTRLRPEAIGSNNHFLTLGINSLKGAEILEVMQKQFDLKLPHSLLFEFPTAERLAEMLVREHKDHLSRLMLANVNGSNSLEEVSLPQERFVPEHSHPAERVSK